MSLRKIEQMGYLALTGGSTVRYPPTGRLDLPWTGLYIHNLSDNFIYITFDRNADQYTAFPMYDWDWRDFDGYVIQEYFSVYGGDDTTIFFMGYSEWKETDVVLRNESGEPAAPIAVNPLVKDSQFYQKKRPTPPTPTMEARPKPVPLNLLVDEDDDMLEPDL